MKSKDSKEDEVSIGDNIKVLEIDERILRFMPRDEKEELTSLVGQVFFVRNINSDGSMLVSKTWKQPESGEVMGHDVAIFPKGALLTGNDENV